jgi:hypothetical protein
VPRVSNSKRAASRANVRQRFSVWHPEGLALLQQT